MRHKLKAFSIALLCVIAAGLVAARADDCCAQVAGLPESTQTPARDTKTPRAGSARILGRVVRADTGAPVRRALVLLYGSEVRDGRPVMTDAEGNYDSGDLPAGTYHVTVTKQGLLNAEYGAKNPGEPGRAVTVAEGEKLEAVNIPMTRGGSIAGRVLDEYGDPVAGATVQVLRELTVDGMRRLAPLGSTAMGQTDDLGQYRVFGLVPGRYYVAASGPSAGGIGVESPQGTEQVPAYYPGTSSVRDAQALEVAAAQDQTGVDLPLALARTARVSGVCLDARGGPLGQGIVIAALAGPGPQAPGTTKSASVAPDGTFTLSSLPPGDYALVAFAIGTGRREQGTARVTVAATDVSGITIQTSTGSSLSGHIVFEGTAERVPSASRVSLSMANADPLEYAPPLSRGGAEVQADGSFRLTGLFGQQLLTVTAPPGWMLKGVYHRGRDVTDTPFACDGREAIAGVQVVLTDRVTRVNASVAADAGEVPEDAEMFVFADDPARWNPPLMSRYVRHMFCQDGSVATFTGLPPGDYFAVAVADVRDPGELMDPAVLERLRGPAQRFSLKEGETKQLGVKAVRLQ